MNISDLLIYGGVFGGASGSSSGDSSSSNGGVFVWDCNKEYEEWEGIPKLTDNPPTLSELNNSVIIIENYNEDGKLYVFPTILDDFVYEQYVSFELNGNKELAFIVIPQDYPDDGLCKGVFFVPWGNETDMNIKCWLCWHL